MIIPNYNYANYLREAVDSALNQTYSDIEVIVVDDGSKDGSRQVIETYGTAIAALFQENQGVSAARNNGVAASSGVIAAFLDADDVWHPKKIELQVERFLTEQEIGLIHVGVQDIDADGRPLAQHLDGMEGEVATHLLLFERGVILGGGSGIMVSRKVFDEIGGFDTRLSTSADWDLFFQVSSRYRTAFIPEILLNYRIHGSNMHGNIPRMEHEMVLGYKKAFDTDDQSVLALKRRAMGNLHRVLAGSYFHAGNYEALLKHATLSIWNRPAAIGYFLEYPLRRFRKSKRGAAPGVDTNG